MCSRDGEWDICYRKLSMGDQVGLNPGALPQALTPGKAVPDAYLCVSSAAGQAVSCCLSNQCQYHSIYRSAILCPALALSSYDTMGFHTIEMCS